LQANYMQTELEAKIEKYIQSDIVERSKATTERALLRNDMEYIKKTLASIENQLSDKYIMRAEFEPVKKVVYGLVGLVLTGVVTALIALVLNQ